MSRSARRLAPPYLDSVRRRRQAELLLEYVPADASGYVEPLLDGGAVAVALLARHPKWSFVLGSANRDLVTVWATVRAEARELVERVAFHAERHGPAYFAAERELAVRGGERAGDAAVQASAAGWAGSAVPDFAGVDEGDESISSDVDRAARFIYLRGTAAPEPGGLPLRQFEDATLGRDAAAFDATGLLELASVLRDRDVSFVVGSPFSFLSAVREDDLVFLDPPAGTGSASVRPAASACAGDSLRELRSFTGAVTAKGGAILVQGRAGSPDAFDTWRDLRRLDEPDMLSGLPDLGVWANKPLRRMLLAENDALRHTL